MFFRAAGIMVIAIFYIGYFIKMIVQRKNGIITDHMGKGKTGLPKIVETALKAVSILMVILDLSSIILDRAAMPFPVRIAGLVLCIFGTSVFFMSMINMKNNWRAGVPEADKTELVTDGIYKFSRNPAFLGFDLVYTGISMMFFNWVLWFFTVAAVIIFHLQIVNVEEPFLTEAFGAEYKEYSKKVFRYIGRKP